MGLMDFEHPEGTREVRDRRAAFGESQMFWPGTRDLRNVWKAEALPRGWQEDA